NKGNIGIVAASGTGLQEVCVQIDALGCGVSQAIGIGGRDLSKEVDGRMMMHVLNMLENDPQTEVILLVSKPPVANVAEKILKKVHLISKPCIIGFLNGDEELIKKYHAIPALSLEKAAIKAVKASLKKDNVMIPSIPHDIATLKAKLSSDQKYIRGLYCGGTICAESELIIRHDLGDTYSNIAKYKEFLLVDPDKSEKHSLIDLGDDFFTVGRPHPMIDPELHNDRLIQEAQDNYVAVILIDVVLGYGSHKDPTGIVISAIQKARELAKNDGRELIFVAYVLGTDKDFQFKKEQENKLTAEGVLFTNSNAEAATFMCSIIKGLVGKKMDTKQNIFSQKINVINVGLESFFIDLEDQHVEAVQVNWQPIGNGSNLLLDTLEQLQNDPKVKEANEKVIDMIFRGEAFLEGIKPAIECIPNMTSHTILHAGPLITYKNMADPMQGAIQGALVFEGLAKDIDEADILARSGKIIFAPCHAYDAVGPMAGILSPSMPVHIILNKTFGNRAYCSINEGLGKVLRFGANDKEVIDRLIFIKEKVGPTLNKVIQHMSGIDIKTIIAQAIQMGDEGHNRNKAATSLFFRIIAPKFIKLDIEKTLAYEVLSFVQNNDHYFLNVIMPSCKAILDAAHGVPNSTIVTTMARNGVDFGIRVSGAPKDTWFISPANCVQGLYFSGYTEDDACPDLGDSAITETTGIGGFLMGGAPAIIQFVGENVEDALNYTRNMYYTTTGESPIFNTPPLDFRGAPTGIDILKVINTNILPIINTGIAHKKAGVGQIGAGLATPPIDCFIKAVEYFAK
ncbi:MAG: DUF1116 domain-containing protein, partial [Brevinema sp.]